MMTNMPISLILSIRQLWRFRAANVVIVATLAMTTGALLAVAAIANNLLVHPWTYDTERLGVLQHRTGASGQLSYSFSAEEFRAVQRSGLFEQVAAAAGSTAVLQGDDGVPSQVRLVRTVPAALAVTDSAPLIGRFVEDGDVGAANPAVVISHALWKSQFNARQDVLGRLINLNGVGLEVVGVMPERFHYLGGDIWTGTSSRIDTDSSTDRQYIINFKLRSAGDLEDSISKLANLAAQLSAQGSVDRYPPGWTIVGERVIDAVMGPMKPALLLILGATVLMLLIGIVNVTTLLTARQMEMSTEASLRVALGARYSNLAVLAFIQNLLLSLLGVAVGWALGAWLFGVLVGLISVDWVPRELEGHFRYVGASLGWIPALSAVIAMALTAAQMARMRRLDPGTLIRGGLHAGGRRGVGSARRLLVGTQVAAAAFVAVIAIAIGTSAQELGRQSPGFDAERVLTTRVTPGAERYSDAHSRHRYYERLIEKIADRKEVAGVAVVDAAPFQRFVRSATVNSAMIGSDESLPVDYHSVYGDLEKSLGIKLLEGRLIGEDDRENSLAVAVVTRNLAERISQTREVIGRSLQVRGQSGEPVHRTIVGVVADIRHDSPLANPRPTIYVPYTQDVATSDGLPPRSMEILVRLRDTANDYEDFMQDAIVAVDPMVPISEVALVTDRGRASMAGVTLAQRLFSMFALIATGIAVLGCHVMLRVALQVRRREFAIKSSIGAPPRHLFGIVVVEGLAVSTAGAVAGTSLGIVGVRAVNMLLQGVAETSPTQASIVVVSLTVIGVLASVGIAIRAARTLPIEALRSS